MKTHARKYPSAVSCKSSKHGRRGRGTIESHVCGIPCLIQINDYIKVEGDSGTWASDWDYYGYEEIDWEVLDRRGRPAPWLERKLDELQRQRIEEEISNYMKGD